MATDLEDGRRDSNWTSDGQDSGVPRLGADASNGAPNDHQNPDSAGDYQHPGDPSAVSASNGAPVYREKQLKPNKVYIGGLPENTRQEDLQNCFGKIGTIVNIELKVGYGFVEFDSEDAASESVAKYNEGFFMGNKIRVEISHGGGRAAGITREPGACFRCGQMGHWARECPNHSQSGPRRDHEPPLIDRIDRPRDYYSPGPRDARYDYPPPPRDYRRPLTPPRDYRDFPHVPPAQGRPYDDYRRGPSPDRYGPSDFRGRYADPGYRYNAPPPPGYPYDRYDRRPNDRYSPYPPPPGKAGPRPRSPPRYRDDYDRAPGMRDYPDYRGRTPPPPARYGNDYRGPSPDRYRRRSVSPPPRAVPPPAAYDYAAATAPVANPPAFSETYTGPPSVPAGGVPRNGNFPTRNGDNFRRP